MNNAVNKVITFAFSAGNDDADACNSSPASAANAITVGAINSNDGLASWTNWGTCVCIYALGVSITAAWIDGSNITKTISGTSMASPHVCGLADAARQIGLEPQNFLTSMASKKTFNCRSPGTGASVNPNLDCSATLSTACP